MKSTWKSASLITCPTRRPSGTRQNRSIKAIASSAVTRSSIAGLRLRGATTLAYEPGPGGRRLLDCRARLAALHAALGRRSQDAEQRRSDFARLTVRDDGRGVLFVVIPISILRAKGPQPSLEALSDGGLSDCSPEHILTAQVEPTVW
jgi:hypothetical protein